MPITPATIEKAILSAPGWVRAGLTEPKPTLRADAYRELGEHVYHTLFQPADTDRDQMALPL